MERHLCVPSGARPAGVHSWHTRGIAAEFGGRVRMFAGPGLELACGCEGTVIIHGHWGSCPFSFRDSGAKRGMRQREENVAGQGT